MDNTYTYLAKQVIIERFLLVVYSIYNVTIIFIADRAEWGIGISIFCPFIIMGLSYLLPSIRLKPDLSYGMFLYHWIILNIIVHFQLLSK